MARATNLLANRSFFRQLTLTFSSLSLLFILLFWGVILVAEDQMEVISLHHWLDAEARMFERDYLLSGEAADLPNHYEFDSYWSEAELPAWLQPYQTPGFYEHHLGPEDKHFLVRPHPSGQGLFYVVFKDNADDYLDEYESRLHLVTLALGFTIALLALLSGLWMVQRMAEPLRNVVSKINRMSPDQPALAVEAKFAELRTIEQALSDSQRHIAAFFQREQEFSRFAAHEIRTPLMVLQGSAELLEKMLPTDARSQKALRRIERACQDIALLTDTFLLLGREHIEAQHFKQLSLQQVLTQQLPIASNAVTAHSCHWQLQLQQDLSLSAPESFLLVVLHNLLKNAFLYGEGEISIRLQQRTLTITNACQPQQDSKGYGYGLVIVERICSRLEWQFELQQQAQQFVASLTFPTTSTEPDATKTHL